MYAFFQMDAFHCCVIITGEKNGRSGARLVIEPLSPLGASGLGFVDEIQRKVARRLTLSHKLDVLLVWGRACPPLLLGCGPGRGRL